MAREQPPSSALDSDGARPTVAVLAALLLAASVLAPVSTTAAVGPGGSGAVAGAASDADATTVAADETTSDGTTTTTAASGGMTTASDGTTTTVTSDETTTDTGNETATTTTASGGTTTTVADDGAATTTAASGGTTTTPAANDGSVAFRGTVTDADGDPVANDSVRLGTADSDRTDEDGRYRLRGERNRSYDLTYRQADAGADRDGVPAVYAVGRTNASTDRTRNVSLPAASVLNVTVVAENGTRVGNATVRLVHERDGATAALTGRTDPRGRLTVAGRVGVELAGTVTVAVEAPNGSLENRTVAVSAATGTAEVVLPLNDTDPPTLRYEVAPRTANVSERVTFDASDSTDESGLAGTTWTVDGQPFDSPVVEVPFSEPGTYSVEVAVTDHADNENATTVPITVVDERAPTPALSVNATTALTNESVLFDASNASDDHRIDVYRWDLDGDGAPERNTSEPTVVHEYAANGTFDVTVVVEDASGNRANATRRVTVERPPPTAAFSVSDPRPRIDESVAFDASPSRAAGNLTEYVWTFEDGKQVPDRRVVTTRWPDSGTYNVTLTVTDEYGRTDNRTRTVVVPNKPPQADAGSNQTAVAGETVTLDGSYSTDPDDDVTFEWTQLRNATANRTDDAVNRTGDTKNRTGDTGNRTDDTVNRTDDSNATRDPAVDLSNASAAAPTFTAPNVTATEWLRFAVTVTDDHGANDTDSVSVAVVPRAPPTVSHSPAAPTVGEEVTFRANRSGAYAWDFDGDGTAETRASASNTTATATHRFDAAGKYDVTLVDAAGRTLNHTVRVVAENESRTDDADRSPKPEDGTDRNGSTGDSPTVDDVTDPSVDDVTDPTGDGDTDGTAGDGDTDDTDNEPADPSAGSSSPGSGPSTDDVNGDDANGGDTDSGRAGDSRSADETTPASPTVSVERVNGGDDRVVATVENAAAGDAATVRLPDAFGGGDAAFESVAVVPDGASNVSLSVAAGTTPPDGAGRPDADAVLSYLEVEQRDAAVESARFRFRVAVERLDEAGVSPEAVRLYRYHDGEWRTLATNHTATEGGFHRFEAVSPGFSVFAVGVGDGTTGPADATRQPRRPADDPTDDADANDAGPDDRQESGEDSGSDGQPEAGPDDDGSDSDVLLVGLFAAALVAAALWGYLLS